MKLSTILETLASARLPSVTSEQLRQLVGTADGKAFADDLRWFAVGETKRRQQLAAVVHAIAPGVRRTVEQLGFQFDLPAIIAAARLDGCAGIETIKAANANPGNRARAVAYLQVAGLQVAARAVAATPAPAAPIEAPYYSFKIFGGSAALCVSEARTRSSNQHTIQIEGALALGAGRREFDWQNKIIVQLTVQESYTALALFENLIPSVKFDGHGPAHDKSLLVDFQHSHYFVRVIQRGRAAIALPVRPVDTIQIIALLYRQLLANEPHLQIGDIRALVARMASMDDSH
ncbi:hypothetical protein ACFOY5_20755 [Massilia aurea]|uniref:hypothetical protein n=1 Tax=Massilia aurea TaxID=373040 RepID=UPI0021636C8D|nr:hypothetical protein [Massilia aurea]MCS0710023.1 hypothetical protein [Massilia aurea]